MNRPSPSRFRALIIPIALLVSSATSFAESALSPSSIQSFREIFDSAEQTARRNAQEAAAQVGSQLTPFLLDFIPVPNTTEVVSDYLDWSAFALETSGRDHVLVPDPADKCRTLSYEQLGPHRSSRAMAIVHLGMFEAVNAVTQTYESYVGLGPMDTVGLDREIVLKFAVAHAAHGTLSYLYKNQKFAWLDVRLKQSLPPILESDPSAQAGAGLGVSAADAVIANRKGDGADDANGNPVKEPVLLADAGCNATEPAFPFKGTGVGDWAQDPVSRLNVALGANWPKVKPFAMTSADQFRIPPISIDVPEFKPQIDELIAVGGAGEPAHGTKSKTSRTPTQTNQGIFWGYDGVPSLCAPPTLYNQVIRAVLRNDPRRNDIEFVAHLFAIANLAMADAGIAAWDSKFHHQVARPITYIRGKDGGPTDGSTCLPTDATCQRACQPGTDAKWCPLGAPATNGRGPNFTPPFPAYPSGHAVFGAALFQTLRTQWPDDTSFTFVSDEFNGSNYPASGKKPRPELPQSWGAFSDAERENAKSRIWLGIHWQADADAGIAMGHCVANWVTANVLKKKGEAAIPVPPCDYSF